MGYGYSLKSGKQLANLILIFVSLYYIYLCFPFNHLDSHHQTCSETVCAQEIIQAIDEDGKWENDKLVLLFSSSDIFKKTNFFNMLLEVHVCHWTNLEYHIFTPRPPPIQY